MSEEVSSLERVGVVTVVLALLLAVFNVVWEILKQLIVEYVQREPCKFVRVDKVDVTDIILYAVLILFVIYPKYKDIQRKKERGVR